MRLGSVASVALMSAFGRSSRKNANSAPRNASTFDVDPLPEKRSLVYVRPPLAWKVPLLV
ncbi:MAG: hypothetical protein ACREF4_10430 [Gammaproteobacteria bacterium]